jgi:hypothetical protein
MGQKWDGGDIAGSATARRPGADRSTSRTKPQHRPAPGSTTRALPLQRSASCICLLIALAWRFTKRETRVSTANRAAYARVCHKLCRAALLGELMTQLASAAEGIGDGEHEEFGERDTLNQEKRAVSAKYP